MIFAVEDSGIGIALAAQQKLFRKFSQADSATTGRFGGARLGLAISKHLVENYARRNRRRKRSRPGLTLLFHIPQARTSKHPTDELVTVTLLRNYGDAKILIAEDNAVNQKLPTRMLERRGCAVDVANNGAEAVSLASHTRHDLILMDCQMPEMDGFEATRRILHALGDQAPSIVAALEKWLHAPAAAE